VGSYPAPTVRLERVACLRRGFGRQADR